MTLRHLLIAVPVAIALVAGAAIGYEQWKGGTPVAVVPVRSGPMQEHITEQGKTRLPRTHLITMPYEGRILPIDLEEGSAVERGQLVARIVPEDLQIRFDEAQAAVARLEAAIREEQDTRVEEGVIEQVLEYLESIARTVEAAEEQVRSGKAKQDFAVENLQRVQILVRRNAASEEDLSRVRKERVEAEVDYQQGVLLSSAIRSLQAAVTLTPSVIRRYIDRKGMHADVLAEEKSQAEARLEQVRLDRQRAEMTSPVNGVVLRRAVADERLLAAGAELLELGDLDELEIEAEVLTQDAVRIAPGQRVEIGGLAVGGSSAQGTVRRLDPAAFTKVSSLGVEQQRVNVIIAIEPESLRRLRLEKRLGVGYRVLVRILTAERSQALLVPRSALFRDLTGAWQVFTVRDGRAQRQTIEVGLMSDDEVEVTRGLVEGDLVVPAPEADLAEGTRVRPIVAEELVAIENAEG